VTAVGSRAWQAGGITLFPELLEAFAGVGIPRRAREQGLWSLQTFDPRQWTCDRHRTVDDRPYGGGPGMVMKPEPLVAAIEAARAAQPDCPVVYVSPQGRRFDQAAAADWARGPGVTLLCGRYEGIDERVIDCCVDAEWSLGDFVLSGGEVAAMAMLDAVVRLLPGALGHEASSEQDSFADGLLDWPHYTRPEVFAGRPVPEVLLGGDHRRIAEWRRAQSIERTRRRRPDLFAAWLAQTGEGGCFE